VPGRPLKRCRLPRLPTGVLAVVWLASLAAAAQPVASVYSRTEPKARPADTTESAAQAERIVASALATLGQAQSVSLRLRQRVRLGNRVLVGAGRYLQAGRGEERRFRFDTTLTCDTESFEITEVSDGLFFWSHRRIGANTSELQRVDVQRVRSRLAELEVPDPDETAAYLGGMQRLMWWTRQWFQFQEAVPGESEGRPVWFVTGRTPPTALAAVMPHLAEAAGQPDGIRPEALPDGWPFAVRLTVGRADLLPRRLEFLAIPGTRPVAPAEIEPIAVVDLLDIEIDGPVDAAAFFYQPATAGLIDVTNQHVSQLAPLRP